MYWTRQYIGSIAQASAAVYTKIPFRELHLSRHFLFRKNLFYKNVELEICEMKPKAEILKRILITLITLMFSLTVFYSFYINSF